MSKDSRRPSAPGPNFGEADFRRALNELDLLLQDQEWPAAGYARLRQNELVIRLRERGITRALAVALLDRLIGEGVFEAGKSFIKIREWTSLDGSRTVDEGSEVSRYLHVTPERWYSHLAAKRPPEGPGPAATPPTTSGSPGGRDGHGEGESAGDAGPEPWPAAETREAEALEALLLLKATPGNPVASKTHVASKAAGDPKGTAYRRALDNLKARGLVESEKRGFRLTERGVAEAGRLAAAGQARRGRIGRAPDCSRSAPEPG
jgi:hypothetical protein